VGRWLLLRPQQHRAFPNVVPGVHSGYSFGAAPVDVIAMMIDTWLNCAAGARRDPTLAHSARFMHMIQTRLADPSLPDWLLVPRNAEVTWSPAPLVGELSLVLARHRCPTTVS
jgi:hypothetical protein